MAEVPENYQRLDGSERHPSPSATLLRPADADEKVTITIVLRRRLDGPPLPGPEFFLATPPAQRQRLPPDDFAALYGASPADIKQVTDFLTSGSLTVVETNAARRTVVASGTVAQMNAVFAVELGCYQHEIVHRRGDNPKTETYRGRDGFIHVPKDIADILIGVFGLDDRSVTKRNGGDPAGTTTLQVPQATVLYNFPTQSAAGQTIAIFSEDGYIESDVKAYFATLGMANPTVTDISVDQSNSGFGDTETTQDICIAASAAPGASIAVYFTTGGEKGWADLLARVVHPNTGDPICSVLSSSVYLSNGDDAATLTGSGITASMINTLSMAFHDAAYQGVTVCIASGDTGTDSKVEDGKAHVQYPASDPWVLSVGGTTIGPATGTSFDEWVWNDSFTIDGFPGSGATGGGVSDFFPLPSYQTGVAIPTSLNDGHQGRGVPDVAANASPNSGYPMSAGGSSFPGSGTSASAPLWAGLMAVINASMGSNVGFVNPAIYSLGSSVFRDIVGSPGPADNGMNGVAGYPAGPGWDACTGWGSINGKALLAGLQQVFNRDCVFITDRNTFGHDEIEAMLSIASPAVIPAAFYVEVDGFRPSELGIVAADLVGVPNVYPTITPLHPVPGMIIGDVQGRPSALLALDPTLPPSPQRFTWVYPVTFTDTTGFVPGGQTVTLTAAIAGVKGQAQIELTEQGNPYEVDGPVPWLSTDTRVFQVKTGETLFGATPMGNTPSDASGFIKSVIANLNTGFTGGQTFDSLATGENVSQAALYQFDQSGTAVFNFALARVRYRALVTDIDHVRVFFRLCPAQSVSVDYDLNTTYRRSPTFNPDGQPIPILGVQNGNLVTIPFFAETRVDTSIASMETQRDPANVQAISHDARGAEIDTYFGCWLDINQPDQKLYPLNPVGDGPYRDSPLSILELVRNQHQCLLAEIVFDPDPIPRHPSPADSDKLAQRNLDTVLSANPGTETSRRIPSTFEIKPTIEPAVAVAGARVDELLIDWGNTPAGSVAQIYIPTVNTSDVLALAGKMYGRHLLASFDSHTLQCPVGKITYIPIPPGASVNHTALLTIDLPGHVRKGQLFSVVVHQITDVTGAIGHRQPALRLAADDIQSIGKGDRGRIRWRSVRGSFQVSIPVRTKDTMLAAEEQLLSLLRWIELSIPATDRWYLVFQRYVSQIGQRVQGLGGNPGQIQPSPIGQGLPTQPPSEITKEFSGKVASLIFDRFGDFSGFVLDTAEGDRRFVSREKEIEILADRIWRDRIRTTVVTEADNPLRPLEIILREPPAPLRP
jgi:kumamolisin